MRDFVLFAVLALAFAPAVGSAAVPARTVSGNGASIVMGSAGVSRVEVDGSHADHLSVGIKVTAGRRDSVVVRQIVEGGDADKVRTAVTRDGNTLRAHSWYEGEVRTGWLSIFGGESAKVRIEVEVPANVALSLTTTNGGIDSTGVSGAIRAQTTNGGIDLTGTGNALDLNTTNGGIKVTVGAMHGATQIAMTTVNGGIHLIVPHAFGARVDASTVNGHIANPFSSASGAGHVKLETVNGSITVEKQ